MTDMNHKNKPIILKITYLSLMIFLCLLTIYLMHKTSQVTKQLQILETEQSNINSVVQQRLASQHIMNRDLSHRLIAMRAFIEKTLAEEKQVSQNDNWLLYKARYYLELAHINTQWDPTDQTTTLTLQQQADALLAQRHDPALLPIRQLLAQEISAQKALPLNNVTELFLQLDALERQIQALPLQPIAPTSPEQPARIITSQTPTWKTHLRTALAQLKDFVVIRRHDINVQPLLTSAQEAAVRLSIAMNISESQWACTQHNDKVFHTALAEATATVTRFFNTACPETQTWLAQIKTLQQQSVIVTPLSNNQALAELNHLLNSQETLP